MTCVFQQMKAILWTGYLLGMTPISHQRHSETRICKVGFKFFSLSTVTIGIAALLNGALFVYTLIWSWGFVKLGRTDTEKFSGAVLLVALTVDWVSIMVSSFMSVSSLKQIIDGLNAFDSHFSSQSRAVLTKPIRPRTVLALISFVLMETLGVAAGLRAALYKTVGQYESIAFCGLQTLVFSVITVRYLQLFVVIRHLENRFCILRTEIEKALEVPEPSLFVHNTRLEKEEFGEKYRLLYMQLLDLFPVIDKMFPERIISLGTALLMSACYTYKFLCAVFFRSQSPASLHIVLFLMNFSALLRIYVTGDAGARLTEAATVTVQPVQRARISRLSHEMQSFLLAANGRQNPCITASGFFPLSREIFSSMIHIIVTYIIVLLQFQNGNGGDVVYRTFLNETI